MPTVRELAALLDGDIVGDPECAVTGIGKIEEAAAGDISFLSNPKYEKYLGETKASAVLVSRTLDVTKFATLPPAVIKVADPYASFVVLIGTFQPAVRQIDPGIHPTAVIHPSAAIGDGAAIGAYAVIGEGCVIGRNATIFPHVVIGNFVRIGDECRIYPHCTVREQCVLGNRVILQPGAVIGGDGFGFAPLRSGAYQKIPQLGIVVLEDDVEVQANSCVDRAVMGETRIKHGAKIDNLVQIAHNVTVGEDTVIAGMTAVAGSAKIGSRVMIGGHVAIAGHLSVADGTKLAGWSAIAKSITEENKTYWGSPAKEYMKAKRIQAASWQVPELLGRVDALEKKLAELEQRNQEVK
jgi:UDP-3-O-[3-hydroxymyristoyl] glucosamine N-acyltransferase